MKTRIKSIVGTKKITRAMQLVSAAKMRKAQNATLASRAYSNLAWELIANLSANLQSSDSLLKIYPEAKKIGIVLLTSNGGLVGSLNANLAPKLKEISGTNTEVVSEVITYGKKAKIISLRMHKTITAEFTKIDKTLNTSDIYPLIQFVTDLYKTGEYQKIVLVYNHFVSTLVQKPTVKQLLPFIREDIAKTSGNENANLNEAENFVDINQSPYLFEPDPLKVLSHLLPRIVESQIYQAILESNASEQSARMVMMKNATEAAGDLIDDLTLAFNQLRQSKITTELAEITAGKIALE